MPAAAGTSATNPGGTISAATVTAAQRKLNRAFNQFSRQFERVTQTASIALGNGGNPNSLFESAINQINLRGGTLLTQAQKAASLLPAGVPNLFSPPNPVHPSYPVAPITTASIKTVPDATYYVAPNARLQTQIQSMLAYFDGATNLGGLTNSNSLPLISQYATTSGQAMLQYVNCGNTTGAFTVSGWTETLPNP
jgi:hypothetical protein